MNGWVILDKIIGTFPPIVMALILIAVLAAVLIFIVGFSKHGLNFLKYGFKQTILDASLEKRFDDLGTRIGGLHAEFKTDSKMLESKIEAIEINHFGHLKNYLGILNGVLLDKQIIDNETKARLDNELRGM